MIWSRSRGRSRGGVCGQAETRLEGETREDEGGAKDRRTANYEAEQEYGRVPGLCERRGFGRAPGEIYQLSSISTNRIQLALYTVVEEGQTREEGRGPRD